MALSAFALNIANNLSRQGLIMLRESGSGDPFVTMGEQGELSVTMTSGPSTADTAGREKQNTVNVEIAASLLQTSDTELAELSTLTNTLLDVVVAPSRTKAEDLDGVAPGDSGFDAALEAATTNGLMATEVLAQAEPDLNFMGESSSIGITIGYRIAVSEIKA